ncbi:hypothetical protein Ciccas_014588 [Cichlidogyrus casuarinus]|uniref:Uncharacterized protein n=1 Tax=Cichlidogyrus casuarinus TaxID=1844966 RepID=A0ABD2PHZ5_9PLAT
MPNTRSEVENDVLRYIHLLKQMKKASHDLNLELQNKRSRNEEERCKTSVNKKTVNAKEEAAKLLKSGAISISSNRDTLTFKRRGKEVDCLTESDEIPLSSMPKAPPSPPLARKPSFSYSNFVHGEKLFNEAPKRRDPTSPKGFRIYIHCPNIDSDVIRTHVARIGPFSEYTIVTDKKYPSSNRPSHFS